MFKNYEFEWVDAWCFLLWITSASLVLFLFIYWFSNPKLIGYSLYGCDGQLKIEKQIDWNPDETIQLDRSITYWEAIRMVDSLNATIKK